MPIVYDWPPLQAVGHMTRRSRPGALSYDQRGAPYYSQSQASRQVYRVTVLDHGSNKAGAGYIYMLQDRLDGIAPLVRIRPIPPLWWGATAGLAGLRGASTLEWYADGRDLDWNDDDVVWTSGSVVEAISVIDGVWYAIECTGLPTNRIVALPGEQVRDSAGTIARVLKVEWSDAKGKATIRLDGPLVSGDVVIGAREPVVMLITSWPDSGLGLGGSQSTFEMRQVFLTDKIMTETAVEYLNPWGSLL